VGLGVSEWFSGFSHMNEVSRVFGVCERFCGFWCMGEKFCGFWNMWGFL
jgi:hypothetical protein